MLDVLRCQRGEKSPVWDRLKVGLGTEPNESRNASIRSFLRGISTMEFSSGDLCGAGVEVEQHVAPAGERPEATIDSLVLCLWQHKVPMRYDHPNSVGAFVPKLVEPDTFSLYTAGAVAPVRALSPSHILMCAFDNGVLQELREEMREEGNIRTIMADGSIAPDQRCFMDPQLRHILLDLVGEAKMVDGSDPIALEIKVQALLDHLLVLTHSVVQRRRAPGILRPKILRRLRECIEDDPRARLDLKTLSRESGYSRRHLIRLFHGIGRSPHQYILDLRLEKARALMLKRSLSLIDIAYECGFSSHAHFTRAFRQRFRTTPNAFRRILMAT
jgi:AraC family transcriptional regulator